MTFVYIPGQAARLAFEVPKDSCCNCGTAQAISVLDTPLKKTRYMLLAGTELRFLIGLPYCKACKSSATRFPVSIGKKLLISALIFVVLMLAVAIVGIDFGGLIPVAYLPHTVGILALALSFGYYETRKTKSPQTSYFQPVTLTGLKQKFSGEIVSLTLKFSNSSYADRFASLNSQFISSGALIVVRA